MKVCALIPAFNEAHTITRVVEGLRPHVADVVVVDDGSTDGTAEQAIIAGARVLKHAENRGKGHAIRTGLNELLASDITHVLLLDGDLQHAPEDAPVLIKAARVTGSELVIGERLFDRRSMPAPRYYSNTIGSRVLSWFIGTSIRDSQSGFRLIATSALRRVRLTARGYEIETEILIKLARQDIRIARVPIQLCYQGARSKLHPVRDTTKTCFLAVHYRFFSAH